MHPAILAAALSFSVALAMAWYVASRREKNDFHWLLLALLGTLMIWTAGTVYRHSTTSLGGLRAALSLIFLGIFTTPSLWLLLAARYTRVRALMEHRELYVVPLIPSALAYLAHLTNEGHRLVVREISFEALEAGAVRWAGPVFWASLAWIAVCVLAAAVLYIRSAREMIANDEGRRGLLLAFVAVFPFLTSLVYVFQIAPVPFDLTPASLSVALVALSVAIFRYQLLESLPLARRDVIEHLQEGVVLADAQGEILDVNPAAERILGSGAGALRRRPLAPVLAGLAREAERAPLREAIATADPHDSAVVREVETPDGRRVQIQVSWGLHGSAEPSGRFAVLRDRTEERRDERVVRQNQKLETVGTLAAGLAHEINNPLAFIRSNLTQLERLGRLVDQQADLADEKLWDELRDLRPIAAEALDGIGRIERIVSDMRRFSQGCGDDVESVDVNAVARDAVRLADLGRDGSIEVHTRLFEGLPPVEGSHPRLVQALLNLVVNAKQALGDAASGRLDVQTEPDGEHVALRVRDNGPGIPAELQERIFDPFFTTKAPNEGTGLGLAIVFDIVRDHGGSLEVDSRPGAGTSFVARLPTTRP